LAEVIKYGLILDEEFFRWLEQHMEELLRLDAPALGFAIRRSCELKAQIVAEDERDHGRRALLNLGHTFGHALEALGDYGQWLHGEAVAIGIHLACATSEALGWIGADDAGRVESLLRRAQLPLGAENVDADRLLALMSLDKKADAGGLKLVLLEGIGKGVVVPAPEPSVLREVIGTKLAA
jgi:3-dehydroquinate synthase